MAKLEEEIRQLHAERGVAPHQIIEGMLDNTYTNASHTPSQSNSFYGSSLSSSAPRAESMHVAKTKHSKFYQDFSSADARAAAGKDEIGVTGQQRGSKRPISTVSNREEEDIYNANDNVHSHHLNTHDLQSLRDQYNIQQNKNKHDDSNSNQSMSACSDIEDQVSGDERPPVAQVLALRESDYSKYRAGTISSSNGSGDAPHSSSAYTSVGSNSGGSNESDNQPNSGDEKVVSSSSSSSDCSSSASRHHRSDSTAENKSYLPSAATHEVPGSLQKSPYPGGYPAHFYPRDHDRSADTAHGNETFLVTHKQTPHKTVNRSNQLNNKLQPLSATSNSSSLPGSIRRVSSNPQF